MVGVSVKMRGQNGKSDQIFKPPGKSGFLHDL